MSIFGNSPDFWRTVKRFVLAQLSPYLKKMPAIVQSVSGTPPNQKAVVARPDELAALAAGEITQIARPAYPVIGSVAVGQRVWCLVDGAGLMVIGDATGGGGSGTPGADGRGFTPRGAWNSSTVYAVDDITQYGGSTYRNKVAGSGSSFPPNDAAKWEEWARKGDEGDKGDQGDASTVAGPPGPGVPTGGSAGQILAKTSNANYATGWVDAPSGGSVGAAEFCRVERTSPITGVGTWETVTWNSEVADTAGWFPGGGSSQRIRVSTTGVYMIQATCTWYSAAGYRFIRVSQNGNVIGSSSAVATNNDQYGRNFVVVMSQLSAGDDLTVEVWSDRTATFGAPLSTLPTPYFAVARIK